MISLYLTLIDTDEEKRKFILLYEEYRNLMLFVAHEILNDIYLSEDAVQEAFLRIAKNFKKIKEPVCPQTKSFVVIITRNVAINIYNKEKKISDFQDYLSDVSPSTSDDLFNTVSYKLLAEHILKLPEHYRDILYLYHLYGYNFNEIAHLLGISVNNAKKRAQRARMILKSTMEREVFFYE